MDRLREQFPAVEPDGGKPSWDDAPEWAQWLAQDRDGQWFWFRDKPVTGQNCWATQSGSRSEHACVRDTKPSWHETLEERPASCDKPSWEESPECANWLAQDGDGIWRWFSDKPSPMYGYWGRGHVGSIVKWAGLGDYNVNWRETLEERPGKPSWDDAPEWAQWLSQGADGAWKFHSTRPKFFDGWGWLSTCLDKQIFAGHGKPNPRWHETLEQRP
jgi:hypothetical protein